MSFLHCLVPKRVASSQSKMFSHFSFHLRNRWYKPSLTVQSILGPSIYGTNWCICIWRLAEWASACDCSSWEVDWSFLRFGLVIVNYFRGALDNMVSGQKSTQYTLAWVKLLVMLAEGWTFHWITAELLSGEFRCVHGCGSLYLAWPGQNTAVMCATDLTLFPRESTRKVYPVKANPSTSDIMFYPWVTVFITIWITEAFGLPTPSLFSKYKVMLLLCHLRVNWIQIQKSHDC